MDEKKLSRRKKAQENEQLPWWKKFIRKFQHTSDSAQLESSESDQQQDISETNQPLSRGRTRFNRETTNEDEKRKRLGRRLNLVILVLVVLIVLVYLFMRFVNF